jgi:hypothetical protein
MGELRISYEPDDEWMGKITVRIVAGAFAGEGSAWINASNIDEFAKSLDRYPLPTDPPSIIEGGHGGTLDGRRPPQTLVRVTIKPQGPRGDLLVCAELQTDVWRDDDSDLHQSVVARFKTEYALLERFARSLVGVAAKRVKEAVLEGKSD